MQIQLENDTFFIEHLHRVSRSSDLERKYLVKSEIGTVDSDQIRVCDITEDWDVHTDRNSTYAVRNHVYMSSRS